MKKTEPGSSAVRNAATSPLRSSAGPGGLHERHVELARDDVGERGLAEPGRPGEQHVVERLAAPAGRLDEERELVLELLLADEVLEPRRAQRAVELLLARPRRRRLDALVARQRRGARRLARCRPFTATAAAQRGRDQLLGLGVLGVAADAPRASPPPRPRSYPSPTRPSRASARGVGRRRPSLAPRTELVGDRLAKLDDDALGRLLADARARPGSAWRRRPRSPCRSSPALEPESTASAIFGPTPATEISLQEQLALRLGREAVELDAVVAQDQVGQQARLAAPPPAPARGSARRRSAGSRRRRSRPRRGRARARRRVP